MRKRYFVRNESYFLRIEQKKSGQAGGLSGLGRREKEMKFPFLSS